MHLEILERVIDYKFKDRALLLEALTHPSLTHEKNQHATRHNQRLEFLGDAVLQLVLTDKVYKTYPDMAEGGLTQHRAHLANRHTLCRRARAIQLGEFLLLGKGEHVNGGRSRSSNLADAFESLIGAMFLDGGMRPARKFILAQFKEEFANLKQSEQRLNPKGRLQEILQSRAPANPIYRVIRETGPDHDKKFEVIVEWRSREIGRGNGSSKKLAEAAAAAAALVALPETLADAPL